LRQTQPPSGEELSILRAFDPERVYLDSAAG
jgi:hypothetical protein